jgi:hypothetical protein
MPLEAPVTRAQGVADPSIEKSREKTIVPPFASPPPAARGILSA